MQVEIGITAPQRLVLRIAVEFPNLRFSELADSMLVAARRAASPSVWFLEIFDAKPHEVDGRGVTPQLTTLGRAFERERTGTQASVRALRELPRIASEVLEVDPGQLR